MQAAGGQSFVSPLLLSVGLFIHQKTRSRILVDVLNSLGFSLAYDEIMGFQKAAVVSQSGKSFPPGSANMNDDLRFYQWVAHNFDYNEDTPTGHDTT